MATATGLVILLLLAVGGAVGAVEGPGITPAAAAGTAPLPSHTATGSSLGYALGGETIPNGDFDPVGPSWRQMRPDEGEKLAITPEGWLADFLDGERRMPIPGVDPETRNRCMNFLHGAGRVTLVMPSFELDGPGAYLLSMRTRSVVHPSRQALRAVLRITAPGTAEEEGVVHVTERWFPAGPEERVWRTWSAVVSVPPETGPAELHLIKEEAAADFLVDDVSLRRITGVPEEMRLAVALPHGGVDNHDRRTSPVVYLGPLQSAWAGVKGKGGGSLRIRTGATADPGPAWREWSEPSGAKGPPGEIPLAAVNVPLYAQARLEGLLSPLKEIFVVITRNAQSEALLLADSPNAEVLASEERAAGIRRPYAGLRALGGDPHVHTGLAIYGIQNPDKPLATGTPEDAFASALRNSLHWAAVTDYSQSIDDPRTLAWRRSEDRPLVNPDGSRTWSEWEHLKAVVDAANRPGEFAAILGVEFDGGGFTSDGGTGRKIALLPDTAPERYCSAHVHNVGDCPVVEDAYRYARRHGAVMIAANPCRGSGGKDTDWSRHDPVVSLLEIHHGMCEGSAGGLVDVTSRLGILVGAAGGSNSREAEAGRYDRTICWATEISRPAILHAMRARRCYWSAAGHMELAFTLNGAPMGSEIDAGNVTAWAVLAESETAPAFGRVEVLRDGEVVTSAACETGSRCILEGTAGKAMPGVYFAVVNDPDGNRLAISSPVFVGRRSEDSSASGSPTEG
jgi:hypothetical protein